jgi:hypothetical protein
MLFPPITILLIYLIHGYEKMTFFRESVSMEINQKLLDAIGQKRFYPTWKLQYVRPEIRKNKQYYRTEKELKGFEKVVFDDYKDKEYYFDPARKRRVRYSETE